MKKYAISACLCGINCRYDGLNNLNDRCLKLYREGQALLICPEVLGGLSIPRTPCEIVGDRVISKTGVDCTREYHSGAKIALEMILKEGISTVILKEKSPSCGLHFIYDGTFSHSCIEGMGIMASLCHKHDLVLMSEGDEFDE